MRATYDYGHPIVGWNGRGLGTLNNDNSTLLDLGFNSLQIQQIQSAYASGALSDAGYQAIVSGFIPPDQLADFMAADPGAPTASTSIPAPTSPNIQITPGPSPRVAYSTSPLAWFTQSSLIAGVPNWVFLGLGVALLTGFGGGRYRR